VGSSLIDGVEFPCVDHGAADEFAGMPMVAKRCRYCGAEWFMLQMLVLMSVGYW
jgi:hypothetical protein